MWSLLKALLLKWVWFRVLLKSLGSLAFLLPLALLLKTLGWPVLVVLAVLAIPVFIVLAIVGLPIIAVMAIGGGLMAILYMLMAVGAVLVKFLLFVVLPIAVLLWVARKLANGNGKSEPPPATKPEGASGSG